MIVTEQEAARKICWRTMEAGRVVPGADYQTWPQTAFCQGSECMAWQWAGWRADDGLVHDKLHQPKDIVTVHVGYCGAAP